MSHCVPRRLRLHLFSAYRCTACSTRSFVSSAVLHATKPSAVRDASSDFQKRVGELQDSVGFDQCYPRLPSGFAQQTAKARLAAAAAIVKPGDTLGPNGGSTQYAYNESWEKPISVAGKVTAVRTAGSKLVFVDVALDGHNTNPRGSDPQVLSTLQAVCQSRHVETIGVSPESFKKFSRLARVGDSYLFVGWPHRTSRGEFSIMLKELPKLLSPSLHQIPETLDDPETRTRKRHMAMLVDSDVSHTLRIRADLEHTFNDFFRQRGFVKVTTPMLSGGAGGAIARPFETRATELSDQKIHLRIAPELWLKRLIVGGMDKVYEIGQVFRNEGVDATHNPEFTICEFYESYATLDSLIQTTCALLRSLVEKYPRCDVRAGDISETSTLDFLPMLQRGLGHNLPDLESPDAFEQLCSICTAHSIAIPSSPSMPRILDTLSAHFLEPMCDRPTFIINHPACMSPLSKHYRCPSTGQLVAARAELFIKAREYANMYEEENSPFEQRKKFEEQLAYRNLDAEGDGATRVDESYLEALEWGMPPTGGWGCGIDRLVMLLSGKERISDVLSFGSLRNVVGLTKGRI